MVSILVQNWCSLLKVFWTLVILDIQHRFWTNVETTDIKSINVNINCEIPMLKYTIQHWFLWKPMTYSKKYTKKCKKKHQFWQKLMLKCSFQHRFYQNRCFIEPYNISFVKTDVVMHLTTSIFGQNRCCMVHYNIGSSRINVVFFHFFNILSIFSINLNLQIENKTNLGSIYSSCTKYDVQIIIE